MTPTNIVTIVTIVFIIGASWWSKAVKNDPTFSCKRYLKKGCPNIDTLGCDMNTCSIKDKVK